MRHSPDRWLWVRTALVTCCALLAVAALGYAALSAWSSDGTDSATTTTVSSSPPSPALASLAPSPGPTVAPAPVPATSSAAAPTPVVPPAQLAGRVVALDPGHNRDNHLHTAEIDRQVDAGGLRKACNTTGTATASGYPESTFTWALAAAVQRRLEALGARVVLTRTTDSGWGPCVDERAAVANRAHADLLLSLHADGAPVGDRGFHVIEPGLVPGYTDDILAPSHAFAGALRDALTSAGLPQSNYLGVRGLDERTDLGTLNRSDVPAAMVECGNMRDPADAAVLVSPAGQERIAAGLVAGVVRELAAR